MERVSLITRHIEDIEGAKEVTEKHGNEAKEGAAAGATAGTILGGVGGFLVGVGVLAIPGVGPLLAAGVGIPAFASTLAGAGIGAAAGGIIGGLVGLGIPEERAKVYNERVKGGEHLLMVNGTEDDLHRARDIMRRHNVDEFGIYDAPDLIKAKPARTEVKAESAPRSERVVTREVLTDTRDIDRDGEPEVFIVEERKEVR
ncbi:histidine kinase [Allocoleopsis franciscana]|nr:histidine kinase [Allocoleopsis franciscana]